MTRRRSSVTSLERAIRDARAYEMYVAALPIREIAKQLGVTEQTVKNGIERHARNQFKMEVESHRAVEQERLNFIIRQCRILLNETNYIVAPNGKVAVNPLTGEPLVDHSEKLRVLGQLQKASESLRKLMGLDAPAPKKIEDTPTLDAEIERLVEQLGRNGLEKSPAGGEEGANSEAPDGDIH
jgi:predicted transcriptional regulator